MMTYVEGRALIREISYMEGGKEILQMKSTLMMEEENTIVMRTEKFSLIGGVSLCSQPRHRGYRIYFTIYR